MSVSPAREAAFRILCRVDSGRGFAVDLLQGRLVSDLEEVDRRLTTELVMGVLRARGELDFQIERLAGKPLKFFDLEVRTILRLGIYQIRFLARIPKRAAVYEAVELTKAARKRSAAGLVNAVLRKCQPPEGGDIPGDWKELDEQTACRLVPAWMFERWRTNVGMSAAKALTWQSLTAPPITLRVGGVSEDREQLQRDLAADGVKTRPGQYGCDALVVESGSVQAARAVREGRAVIQDEASQLVGKLIAVQPGQAVLDLCAAPGMKTGQLAAALKSGWLLACDLSSRRLRTMKRLLAGRLPEGLELRLVRLDATRELPLGIKFDRILLDAPCSGTGTLARNPEIKWRLQAKDLSRFAEVQANMLRNALKVLAPGGRLVYATCSLEPEENEQVVEGILEEVPGFRLLAAEELSREFPTFAPLFNPRGYFRTRPDLHSMDGFFAAALVSR